MKNLLPQTIWVLRMAWRDSRTSRRRLLLYTGVVTLGVASLVAIQSFARNLEWAVEDQAKTLLGADLALSTRQALSPEAESWMASLPGERAMETGFASMAYFPGNDFTRFVQVRALEGDFPFYGTLETTPLEAARSFRQGPFALVDETLLRQFGEEVGSTVRLGESTFEIAGALHRVPGQSPAFSTIGPRIYIPAEYLDDTGLIQTGSRVVYRTFFRLDPGVDPDALVEEHRAKIRELNLSFDTVERRKENLGRSLANLYGFLNLVGFISLLLGGVGVAGAVHVYVKSKLPTVAVLRCLGATPGRTFLVYLLQAVCIGALGSAAGLLLGVTVQSLLPKVLSDFLPVEIPVFIAWEALVRGFALGIGFSTLFALLPLLTIRKVSPLSSLRIEYDEQGSNRRDPLRILTFVVLVASVVLFTFLQTPTWIQGAAFSGALLGVFLSLAAVARLLTFLVRRYFPSGISYVWRQGLANLYRPRNQTLVLMLALGMGTFLIVTLYFAQDTILRQVSLAGGPDRANLVLFDIQPDQSEEVVRLVEDSGLPVLQRVPIVTMHIRSLNGRDVQEIREDPENESPRWALTREYRSTYREQLIDTEELVSGRWVGRFREEDGRIPVSFEEGIAETLNLRLGDVVVFDVQGIPLETEVGSIRRVEWERFQPNFFVTFPAGVLEEAPRFEVLVTRAETSEQSAALQRAVVLQHPNVSAVDLDLILSTVDAVLDKVAFAVRFLALFTVLTGLLVLTGAVVSGRYQRMRESVLLRTLGASRRQVRRILLIEYLFLGSLAALTGLLLALAAGWALAHFLFEAAFLPSFVPVLAAFLIVVTLTVTIGVLNSRGVTRRPPLEVLRSETG